MADQPADSIAAAERGPPETCNEGICTGAQPGPRPYPGDGEAVANGAGQIANHDEQPIIRSQPASMRHSIAADPAAPFVLGLVLPGFLGWFFYKHRKRQAEWQIASRNQLERIRQRNATAPGGDGDGKRGTKGRASEEKAAAKAVAQPDIGSTKSTAKTTNDNDSQTTDSRGKNDGDRVVADRDRIARVRAKQQELLERNAASARRQRHQRKKKKKKALHASMDHAAADAAYQRRRSAVAEESQLLARGRNEQRGQQMYSELEEAERVALLQQQNEEYQESLRRDQERAKQVAFESEQHTRRIEALAQARRRLTAAGVQCDAVFSGDESLNGPAGSEQKCRVRLLLPSGQRVEGSFAPQHLIGLVYDLALLVLDRKRLLWSQEEASIENAGVGTGTDDVGTDCGASSDVKDYSVIRDEWREIFYPFSIASTFPRRTFDDLSGTLDDCELSGGAMVMVVVETD